MEATGMVFDIKRYALHDGPGIRTTVFLKGCPLRCPWCHNPEGMSPKQQLGWRPERCLGCHACRASCPEGAITFTGDRLVLDGNLCTLCGRCASECYPQALEMVGEKMTVAQVAGEVAKDTVFYQESGGGVTFSGGEPLMQPDFLAALLSECKARGFHTAVDTSGYAERAVLASISDDVDLFLWDLKVADDAQHREQTGVANSIILENLSMLSGQGKRIMIRFSVIPGITDSQENISRIGKLAASLGTVERLDLLPYHRAGIAKSKRLSHNVSPFTATPPSPEAVIRIRDRLARCGVKVQVGG